MTAHRECCARIAAAIESSTGAFVNYGALNSTLYIRYTSAQKNGAGISKHYIRMKETPRQKRLLAYTHVRALSCERSILFYRTDFPWLPSLALALYTKPL